MTDSTTASGRGEFRVVLRGYDREQVDGFLSVVSERIDSLEKERAALVARMGEGGVDDRGSEIDAITTEMNRILHAAHEAAEGMRSRATEDAATWRAEAEAETKQQREEAQEAAEEVRGDAWATASGLLEQVKAYAARLTRDAEQDGLNLRAESEREASRHVAQARQDGDETVRHSRLEADRMMEDARRESHNLIEAAKLEAEAAQERARALEERRAELMGELDVAQAAISKLEGDLTARKEALAAAGRFEPTSSVRVVSDAATDDEWFDPDETVRVVSADDALGEPEPVDAVELADEVRQLRERREQAESAVAALLSKVNEATTPEDPKPETAAEPQPQPQPETAPDPEPEAETEPEPQPESEPQAEEAAPMAADNVANLFAALRTSTDSPTATSSNGGSQPAAAASVASATKAAGDPFELRDRLLLPLTNRTLRTIKKSLVELQNQTLEELREVGEGWRPDRAAFEGAFRGDLEGLAHESLVAGVTAAAELAGSSEVPEAEKVAPTNPTAEVAGSLFAEVDEVAQRAAASGAGHRQATAAVSRVFRTWRSDAAERHLRASSLASYHDGVLSGLETLQVASVKGVADGRMCAECPASAKASWVPTDSTPKGTGIPPVHLDCACTIVPG
ncbi:MAG: DivIVA domain-containing protein [Acidimicrobiia bacterium]|nr:DivIVA domain-containing protein [Acidimicrobiia bacterium]